MIINYESITRLPTFASNEWNDPRTWIALGSLLVGISGFLYGVLSSRWNRRESRLDALSKILHPIYRAAQHLYEANDLRRKCEQLKRSFPDEAKAKEALARVNEMTDNYGKLNTAAHDDFRDAEAEFGARSFRFPDRVTRLVKVTTESLAEFGRLVNAGFFEKADVQFAKFKDDYSQVTRVGRGWRLADPLEGLRNRWRRKPKNEPPPARFELSDQEMDGIMELVHKRATTQAYNTFAVHPPKKLLERSEIATADNVIEELEDSIFVVAFQDGTSRMMSLIELMVFTYNLHVMMLQNLEVANLVQALPNPNWSKIKVSFQFTVPEIMRREMVKFLLQKINFSVEASDG